MKDYKRLLFSAVVGWAMGLLLAIFVSFINNEIEVNGLVMLAWMGAWSVGSWFFFKNNTKIEENLKNKI